MRPQTTHRENPNQPKQQHDVAIIGGGLIGATLAAILAKQGKQVLLLEAKEHPRFAIGESMILETSELMRAAAHFFEVPEIAYFSSENYRTRVGKSHGVKRHFGFWHHDKDHYHSDERTLQAVIPKDPYGHELHLYRQDSDQLMIFNAIRYGAHVKQNVRVVNVAFQSDRVVIEDHRGDTHTASFVVDAGGYGSVVAKTLKMRTTDVQHRSRGLFTHMVNVGNVPHSSGELPYRMEEGTLHHVFDGGWLWVIPFNNFRGATNPVTSVGLLLDPETYPADTALTPDEEFRQFIRRFPSIHNQLGAAKPTRDWVRADRLQYSSKQMAGDRWALLGHAAGFVDPLYSKGLYISMASMFVLAHQLLTIETPSDYRRSSFSPFEKMATNYLERNDRLVANSYRSWSDHHLWQAYSVLWLTGAYTELLKLTTMRIESKFDRQAYVDQLVQLQLHGGGYHEFFAAADRIDDVIESTDTTDRSARQMANRQIEATLTSIEWMPQAFRAVLDGASTLPRRKIRPEVFLESSNGFLGRGNYREHFFGDRSLWDVIRLGAAEKVRHSALAVSLHNGAR